MLVRNLAISMIVMSALGLTALLVGQTVVALALSWPTYVVGVLVLFRVLKENK